MHCVGAVTAQDTEAISALRAYLGGSRLPSGLAIATRAQLVSMPPPQAASPVQHAPWDGTAPKMAQQPANAAEMGLCPLDRRPVNARAVWGGGMPYSTPPSTLLLVSGSVLFVTLLLLAWTEVVVVGC